MNSVTFFCILITLCMLFNSTVSSPLATPSQDPNQVARYASSLAMQEIDKDLTKAINDFSPQTLGTLFTEHPEKVAEFHTLVTRFKSNLELELQSDFEKALLNILIFKTSPNDDLSPLEIQYFQSDITARWQITLATKFDQWKNKELKNWIEMQKPLVSKDPKFAQKLQKISNSVNCRIDPSSPVCSETSAVGLARLQKRGIIRFIAGTIAELFEIVASALSFLFYEFLRPAVLIIGNAITGILRLAWHIIY